MCVCVCDSGMCELLLTSSDRVFLLLLLLPVNGSGRRQRAVVPVWESERAKMGDEQRGVKSWMWFSVGSNGHESVFAAVLNLRVRSRFKMFVIMCAGET